MATSSFLHNVVVKDRKKIQEIKEALSNGQSSFDHIKVSSNNKKLSKKINNFFKN